MRKILYSLILFVLFCTKNTAQNAFWRNIAIPNIPISSSIWDLVFDRDTNFYVTTDTSLFRYNGGVWTKQTPPINVNEKLRFLAVDNQGGLWVSVLNSGVYRRFNNVWQKYDDTNSMLLHNFFYFMKYDSISKLMIFGTFNGVTTFNSLTNTWGNMDLPTGYTINIFDPEDLAFGKTGDWYFSALGRLVYIFKPQTREWRKVREYPLASAPFTVGVDANNNIYASGFRQVLRYDTIAQTWRNLSFMKSEGTFSTGFTVDKKNIMWYFSGDKDGVIRFDTLKHNKFTSSNSPLYSNTINKVVVGPNNLKYIVGKGGGIQILDDANLPLAIKEVALQTVKMIERYNNPIQERLILHFDRNQIYSGSAIRYLTVQMHDLSGKLMFQNVVEVKQGTVELPVALLPSGMYFVTCVDWQNKLKETIKVVKY